MLSRRTTLPVRRPLAFRLLLVAFSTLFLTACALHQPPVREGSPISLPERWSEGAHKGQAASGPWWTGFNNEELNRLVAKALAGNFDLRSAWARLRQARATLAKSGSYRYPQLDADGSTSSSSTYARSSAGGDPSYSQSERYRLGLSASYEVDLWGRINAGEASDAEQAKARRLDLESTAMSVSAEVVLDWIDIMAVREETAILLQQIEVNEQQLGLQEVRFRNGLATALDVTQQREVLAGSKAELPLLRMNEATLLHSLALLLGRAPSGDFRIGGESLPSIIPLPETGIPADLLEARPDIQAALMELRGADWDVVEAKADRLPSLSLSAEGAFSSVAAGVLFNDWLTQLAAGLTAPLFDGGRRKAEVERLEAVVEEQVAAYGQVVAEAVGEVEDALARESRQAEYIVLLEEELATARQAQNEARLRYQQGLSEYLSLLTETLNVQSLERKLVGERAALLGYRVALHRALGGSWTEKLERTALTDKPRGAGEPL